MPLWLLKFLPDLKNAAPYLGAFALVIAAYWWADNRGRDAQKVRDASAISAITQQRDTWIVAFRASDANFRTAMVAIGAMNSDANALADSYTKSKAADALNVAQSNARWENTQKRMSLLQGVIAKNGGCAVARENIDAMGDL